MRIWPGKPYPLGATWDGLGVNFALFSEHASRVELCLFDHLKATAEAHRIVVTENTDDVWHVYLPDVRPGQLYGYRVYGPYAPEQGHRFNHNKILVDPYAKAIPRTVRWSKSMFGYKMGSPFEDLEMDDHDNAAFAPLSAVIDSAFTWGDDSPPDIPWHKTVIYEAHVKGMSMLNEEVPRELRGTYAALGTAPIIRHLKKLGVTAVELMPVHHKVDEWHLTSSGKSNYWGYNTLGYFAPEASYTSYEGLYAHVREFKTMVRALHSAGIEVILDVVYNHTAEGNHFGPTLSLKGIDNRSYYRLSGANLRYYEDFTGCGNTLNMQHPRVLQLIMDSLRYWVLEMHVDGFRFDLASALARELFEVDRLAAFFDIIQQDPVLSRVKLIAEPWDLGEGGYQVGNFPVLWTEWNGRYRDVIRSFWKGDHGTLSEMGTRLAGSSDLYAGNRKPYASINFITCHDGFSLSDLVTYNHKHNADNGEENRDGTDDNRSWNHGVEGPSDDERITFLRRRQMRNMLATLFLSSGVPMLSGGDELMRTQNGNNNAYCQDNDISWTNWHIDLHELDFLGFVAQLVKFRSSQPVLQRRKFFSGSTSAITGIRDLTWIREDGREMSSHEWNDAARLHVGFVYSGDAIEEVDEAGERIIGDTLFCYLNASAKNVNVVMPKYILPGRWLLVLDTMDETFKDVPEVFSYGDRHRICARSIQIFRLQKAGGVKPL